MTADEMTEMVETETRSETEREVVEHEHEYEVCECTWCGGETPVEEAVGVALGGEQTTERVHVATARRRGASNISVATEHEDADVTSQHSGCDPFTTRNYDIYFDKPTFDATTAVPFCAYCAASVFDIETDAVLDAPAMQVHGPHETDATAGDATDGGWSPPRLTPPIPLTNEWVWLGIAALSTPLFVACVMLGVSLNIAAPLSVLWFFCAWMKGFTCI